MRPIVHEPDSPVPATLCPDPTIEHPEIEDDDGFVTVHVFPPLPLVAGVALAVQ